MAELDLFERRVADALCAYASEMPARVDAAAVAGRVAGERTRPWRIAGRLAAVPGLAWILLLAGLLLGLVVGGLAVGLWRDSDRAIVVVPSPSPTVTINAAEATILATARAHSLPAQAICPPGSDPDVPGPADQDRPSDSETFGPMAFDRHAGRIVLAADDGTWTFDVCTNAWQRMRPAQGPLMASDDPADWLVYDADSDRTVAFTTNGQFWSYDLAADRWTKAGSFPGIRRGWGWGSWRTGAVYHDPSGLIVIYDGATMWAYDVEAGTLTEIRQRPDLSRPAGTGIPADPRAAVDPGAHYDGSGAVAVGYDPRIDLLVALVRPGRSNPVTPRGRDETWTLDPGTGTWRLEASASSPMASYLEMAGGPAAYDEVSGLTLFRIAFDLQAFDGGQRAWRDEPFDGSSELGDSWCTKSFSSPVFDPLNGRIVCLGGAPYHGAGPEDTSGVSALSTASGQWRWLLAPLPMASPTP